MFGLTEEERRVILFLLSIALIGAGLNFLAKIYSPVKSAVFLSPDIAKINLNTADKQLLMSVSGIGGIIAQRILDYREAQGAFSSLDELQKIKGMNQGRFAKIKDAFVL